MFSFSVPAQIFCTNFKILRSVFYENVVEQRVYFFIRVYAKKHGLFEECCGYACMNWYKEWYLQQVETGIEQTVSDAEVIATYYYNVAGEKVNKPQKGIYIVKQIFKDGKSRSYKVCY